MVWPKLGLQLLLGHRGREKWSIVQSQSSSSRAEPVWNIDMHWGIEMHWSMEMHGNIDMHWNVEMHWSMDMHWSMEMRGSIDMHAVSG